MSRELVVIIAIAVMWFIRLEVKSYNLKMGKHYILMENSIWSVSHVNEDGSLSLTFQEPTRMTYQKAMAIKKLYPELVMINTQTDKEVVG